MNKLFKMFLAVWLVLFSIIYSGVGIHPILLIAISAIIFVVAMMETITKK